jgi:hypothetical protein
LNYDLNELQNIIDIINEKTNGIYIDKIEQDEMFGHYEYEANDFNEFLIILSEYFGIGNIIIFN